MAIQFPNDFLVADQLGIEIIELAPMDRWRAFFRGRLEMPIDRLAKAKPAKAQEIKLPFNDVVSSVNDFRLGVGPSRLQLTDRGCPGVCSVDAGKKFRLPA